MVQTNALSICEGPQGQKAAGSDGGWWQVAAAVGGGVTRLTCLIIMTAIFLSNVPTIVFGGSSHLGAWLYSLCHSNFAHCAFAQPLHFRNYVAFAHCAAAFSRYGLEIAIYFLLTV